MSSITDAFAKSKPGFIIGIGIGSMIMATLSGIRYTQEAREAIDAKKEESGVDRLSVVDTIKTAGPYFIPSIIFTSMGIACILKGNKMNLNREAAAITAYALSESTLRDYRDRTREIVGEKKERDIREAVAKEIADRNQPKPGSIIVTGNGDCLCFDNVTNQYFKSSKVKIESAINNLNCDMLHGEDVITLNDYCLKLGLEEVELGQELGWKHDENGLIKVSFTAVVTENGDPCLVIVHDTIPKPIYRDQWHLS